MPICNGCIYHGRKTDNAHFWCGFDDRVRTYQSQCINFINKKKMTDFTFKGKIIAVSEKRGGVSKAGNTWTVQEYTIQEEAEQYPMKMTFEVFGENKIAEFAIKEGETLTVHIKMDAREFDGKWYNSIRAWKVDRENTQPNAQTTTQATAQTFNTNEPPF